jgi:hypothetical protein
MEIAGLVVAALAAAISGGALFHLLRQGGIVRMESEVVRIGIGSARIVSITKQRVDYIDEVGQDAFVDLDECASVWNRKHGTPPPTVGGKYMRFIGWRASLYSSPSWVQFYNRRRTRLQFQTGDRMIEELLTGLRKVDCLTNDAT